MRTLVYGAATLAALAAATGLAADPVLAPGLYEVEVRISLPNVQDVAAPAVLNRCVTASDLESGQAFFVLSDNPLKNCPLLDYRTTADSAAYRIACPGPNMGYAVGVFDLAVTRYRGVIAHARVVRSRVPPLRAQILDRVLAQVAARKSPTASRALVLYATLAENADYLDRHPEALLRGRRGEKE